MRSPDGAQVNAQYDLWNDIIAPEFFPPNVDSAFYVLSLGRSVTRAGKAQVIEAEPLKAFELLAAAWPFSGGSFMLLETREVGRTSRYESSAKEVETELLTREGLRHVKSSLTANYEALATYPHPPLPRLSALRRRY